LYTREFIDYSRGLIGTVFFTLPLPPETIVAAGARKGLMTSCYNWLLGETNEA
jgi:hypothetical protein